MNPNMVNRKGASPVLLPHVLPRQLVHHVDLHHGMGEAQVCLQPVRPVDVHAQHQAVIQGRSLRQLCLRLLGLHHHWVDTFKYIQ